MSTQHIEEADELSNRICIMTHGKILTIDTPFHIKRQFGIGYNLLIEPKAHGQEAMLAFERSKHALDSIILYSSIISGVLESQESTQRKLIYQIPFD